MGFVKKAVKSVTGMFRKPKMPELPPVPKAPTAENSAAQIEKAQREELERMRKQRGRAATILTSGYGVPGEDSFKQKLG